MKCPIVHCIFDVAGPLRICKACYALVPIPQREALCHYAKTRKGGPAHVGAFKRACATVLRVIEARNVPQPGRPERAVMTPYRDD
jgi:hypothetical protein